MSAWLQSSLSRREVLIAGAAAAGASVFTRVEAQAAWAVADGQRVSVLLQDRRITSDAALKQMHAKGVRIVMLGEDPVRQWRDESAVWLAPREARLMGITRWHDFLMLRGLAAESRRHVHFASPVSDDGVLTWLIA